MKYYPEMVFDYRDYDRHLNKYIDKISKFTNDGSLLKRECYNHGDIFYTYVIANDFCKIGDKIEVDIDKIIKYLQLLNPKHDVINVNNLYIWILSKNFAVFYNEKHFSKDFILNSEYKILTPQEYIIKSLLE